MESLLELVAFRREALTGFLLVSTILGAFSMSGVLALLGGHEKARLRSLFFVLLTTASLLFTVATLVAVIILPHLGRTSLPPESLRGLLLLHRVATLTLLAATIVLLGSIGGLGFMVSRRVGILTACIAAAALAGFVACGLLLIRALP